MRPCPPPPLGSLDRLNPERWMPVLTLRSGHRIRDSQEGQTVVTDHTAISQPLPPLPEPGPAFAQNRILLAERLKWPDGAVEACDAIEAEYPGWSAYYATPITPDYGEPGFYARDRTLRYSESALYGATPDALREQVKARLDQDSE